MANSFSFNDISTILTSIADQVTGKSNAVATDTGSFISLATATLSHGVDPVLSAISQVIAKNIFSIRPYSRKFKGMEVTNDMYGNQIRKFTAIDKGPSANIEYSLTDGSTVDEYKINLPKVLQTNIVGEEAFDYHITITTKQLRNAFSSPAELSSFISMIMQNLNDQKEQAREGLARMVLANLIGGKIKGDTSNVIHLVSEYNTYLGLSSTDAFTASSIKAPDVYPKFIKWAYARIREISEMMTERTSLYHQNGTNIIINRHTPKENQRLYVYAPVFAHMETEVLSDTFNKEFLSLGEKEMVNFWQSAKEPQKINVKPNYLDANLAVKKETTAVTNDKVFAVLMDEAVAGYSLYDQEISQTPVNARGSYYNVFLHETGKHWTDYTENAVVFSMD